MASVVFDASAVLALLRNEPGADVVAQYIGDGLISAVNFQEVLKGLLRRGVPMDEALVRCVVDLSGRPFLAYKAPEGVSPIGGNFEFQLVEEFLRALSVHAGMNLHVEILSGRDAHHMAEGIFKSLARALDQAVSIDPRVQGIPSTKGIL